MARRNQEELIAAAHKAARKDDAQEASREQAREVAIGPPQSVQPSPTSTTAQEEK